MQWAADQLDAMKVLGINPECVTPLLPSEENDVAHTPPGRHRISDAFFELVLSAMPPEPIQYGSTSHRAVLDG